MNEIESTLATIGASGVNDAWDTIQQGGEVAKIPPSMAESIANLIRQYPWALFAIPVALGLIGRLINWLIERAKNNF